MSGPTRSGWRVGVVLVAVVALAEGLVALMIKPAVDYVLDSVRGRLEASLLKNSLHRSHRLPEHLLSRWFSQR